MIVGNHNTRRQYAGAEPPVAVAAARDAAAVSRAGWGLSVESGDTFHVTGKCTAALVNGVE